MGKRKRGLYFGQIYDSIYGFIRLTQTEEAIINSRYFQRLRWIKQLGFASYIFAGAEHSRFAHVIGVMHSADQMVRALGKDVPDEKLFDPRANDEATAFHKSIRIAAMLHDIGTFPFSHSVEGSYIRHGAALQKQGKLPGKPLPNNHEHLGSYIIKKTTHPGGITQILQSSGLDATRISHLIKGDSDSLVGNQILHSDIDADRLDYLIRDAHHTGIKYGHIDRDYILHHLTSFKFKGQEVLGIQENAIHAVEDFLLARFAWYSQVVRNSDSAKFDVLATHLGQYLLEQKLIYSYDELLKMAEKDPDRFFTFNDVYFIQKLQELYFSKALKDPVIREQAQMLLFRIPPRTLRVPETTHRIFTIDADGKIRDKEAVLKAIHNKLEEIQGVFNRYGKGKEWIIADIPAKDVIFTKPNQLLGTKPTADSIFVISKSGKQELLVQRENSLIQKLAQNVSFLPNVYCNNDAMELLKAKKVVL